MRQGLGGNDRKGKHKDNGSDSPCPGLPRADCGRHLALAKEPAAEIGADVRKPNNRENRKHEYEARCGHPFKSKPGGNRKENGKDKRHRALYAETQVARGKQNSGKRKPQAAHNEHEARINRVG